MFTSGYNDTLANNNATAATFTDLATQQNRKWKVSTFEIWTELQFFEPDVEFRILQNLDSEGLILHTQSW